MMNKILQKIVDEGMPKNRECRRELGIQLLISFCKELGMSCTDTACKLQEMYFMKSKDVNEYIKLYWESETI